MSENIGSILIAEHDPGDVFLLASALQDLGHSKLIVAEDGREVITLCESTGADLVFCDDQMPGISAAELLADMRENSVTARIAAVILAKQSNNELRDTAARFGALDVMLKPVDKNRLSRALSRATFQKKQP